MTSGGGDVRVVDNPAEQRYEAFVGDTRAGFSTYELRPGTVVFLHTEIDPAFEGQGIGSRLAAGALDDVRRRGLSVTVLCPFISDYVRRHPDAADLGM
jgi:predicted GNAT family acetyltransferase